TSLLDHRGQESLATRYLPNRAVAQDQGLQESEGVYQANIKCQCSFRHQASMDSRHKTLFGVRWSPPGCQQTAHPGMRREQSWVHDYTRRERKRRRHAASRAISRPAVSVTPPGGNGTTTLTGLLGYCCAKAEPETMSAAQSATRRTIFFI